MVTTLVVVGALVALLVGIIGGQRLAEVVVRYFRDRGV